MITSSVSEVVLVVVVGAGLALLAATRRLSAGHWLAVAVFAVYLVGVAHFTLMPLRYDPRAQAEFGTIDLGRLVELRPFFLIQGAAMPGWQAALNVLLTVPLGFGLPFVIRWPASRILLAGLLFAIGIELAQLTVDALYLAEMPWSVDINDVLLNTLGAALGYATYRIVSLVYGRTLGRRRVRDGIWAHFDATLRNLA